MRQKLFFTQLRTCVSAFRFANKKKGKKKLTRTLPKKTKCKLDVTIKQEDGGLIGVCLGVTCRLNMVYRRTALLHLHPPPPTPRQFFWTKEIYTVADVSAYVIWNGFYGPPIQPSYLKPS